MDKIIFSKCSLERKECYKIITKITQNRDTKKVYKSAVNDKANDHINRMVKFYENHSQDKGIRFAPCNKVKNGVVEFDYVEGDSLQSSIENHFTNHDYEAVILDFKRMKDLILQQGEIEKFQISQEFVDVFGNVEIDMDCLAIKNADIDMIAENIILTDNAECVIDYEWNFPFLIPIKYILYRSLFYNSVYARLSQMYKDKIMGIYEISSEEMDVFMNLEMNFQNHVSGVSLEQLYSKMGKQLALITTDLKTTTLNKISIYDEEAKLLYSKETVDNDICIHYMAENNKLLLKLCDDTCVIKIKSIRTHGNKKFSMTSNEILKIMDDYYFGKDAEIVLLSDQALEYDIEYVIMHKGNPYITELAESLKELNDRRLQVEDLLNQRDNLINELKKIKNEYLELGDERGELERQLLNLGDERGELEKQLLKLGDERGGLERQLLKLGDERGELERQLLELGDERGKLENQLVMLRSEKEEVSSKLEQVRQGKGWKMYSYINKLQV